MLGADPIRRDAPIIQHDPMPVISNQPEQSIYATPINAADRSLIVRPISCLSCVCNCKGNFSPSMFETRRLYMDTAGVKSTACEANAQLKFLNQQFHPCLVTDTCLCSLSYVDQTRFLALWCAG